MTIIVIHDGYPDCNKASAEKAFANPKIMDLEFSAEEIKGRIAEKV